MKRWYLENHGMRGNREILETVQSNSPILEMETLSGPERKSDLSKVTQQICGIMMTRICPPEQHPVCLTQLPLVGDWKDQRFHPSSCADKTLLLDPG